MSTTNPFAPPGSEQLLPRRHSLSDLPWVMLGFDGRIPRRTYWAGSLVLSLFVVCVFGAAMLGGPDDQMSAMLLLLSYVPLTWASLALQVKRWHDLGMSGWWVLVSFVPLVGGLFVLVWCGFIRGDRGPNEYGADPT